MSQQSSQYESNQCTLQLHPRHNNRVYSASENSKGNFNSFIWLGKTPEVSSCPFLDLVCPILAADDHALVCFFALLVVLVQGFYEEGAGVVGVWNEAGITLPSGEAMDKVATEVRAVTVFGGSGDQFYWPR